MSKHKVLQILAGFSPPELKKFGMFLRKTHGRKETLLTLFDVLRKYHPDFEDPRLEHPELYKSILPGKAFHEKRILNELSALRAAVEQFLIEEYLQEDEHSRNAILLQAYKKHQFDKLFFRQLQKMEEGLKDAEETSQMWLEKMKLAEEEYYYPSTNRIMNETPGIYQVMQHLDHFYAVSKLQYACEILNRQNVLQDAPKEISLLEEVQSLVKTDHSVCFRCYALALRLLDKRADDTYRELETYFKANFRKIQAKDRLIIFSYLINHTSHGIKKGIGTYNSEMIELYRFGVDQEIMITNGYFDVPSFENIVILFCKDKQYEWASQFVKRWGPFLKPEIRKKIVPVSEAYLLFEQSRYDEAQQKILHFEELDFHDHIRAHVLLTCCYVELKEYDSNFIQYKCDNFARATRRSSVINPETERSVLNFIKIVKQLDKPDRNKDSLLKELSEMEFVFSRKWLMEKVQAL